MKINVKIRKIISSIKKMKMVNCFNTTNAIEHLGQNKQQMEIRPICNYKGSAV
jgi:hypothetical protein